MTKRDRTMNRRTIFAGTAVSAAAAPLITSAYGQINADGRFSGKSVLITGGTSGIGEATALAFAREGARFAFNGRRKELGERGATRINADDASGGEGFYHHSDVRD